MQEDILRIPALRQSECAAIRTDRIVAYTLYLIGYVRRIVEECILHVHIERKVITFHLPTRRNIYLVPR